MIGSKNGGGSGITGKAMDFLTKSQAALGDVASEGSDKPSGSSGGGGGSVSVNTRN
jgi:hypothetical protein